MKKIIYLIILLAMYNVRVEAQTQNVPTNVIPASPEAQTLFRYLDYPVSHSTGIPEISIPIHTIQAGSITFPISISYHAGGRKVNDTDGAIGLGWSLNAGGMVARTIYGKDDLIYSINPEDVKLSYDLRSLRYSPESGRELYEGYAEEYKYLANMFYEVGEGPNGFTGTLSNTEYDIFSFMTMNASGKFVIVGGRNIKLISADPVKISFSNDNCIDIIEDSGIRYRYKGNGNIKTDFHLIEVASPDEKHKIKFTWQGASLSNGSTNQANPPVYTMEVTDEIVPSGSSSSTPPVTYALHGGGVNHSCLRMKEIDFGTGKVVFDIENYGGKVKKITIKDMNDTTVKTVELTHSYLDNIVAPNHTLNRLAITDGANPAEVYTFNYHPSLPLYSTPYCDFWGYKNYHSTFSNVDMFPRFDVQVANGGDSFRWLTVGGAGNNRRQPNGERIKDGVLYKITYPTGGSTEFTYEINRIQKITEVVDGPGIRVKKITTTDNNGNTQYRTYEYPEYGTIPIFQQIESSAQMSVFMDYHGSLTYPDMNRLNKMIRKRLFYTAPTGDMAAFADEPVFYNKVTEYLGENDQIIGKTEYRYNSPATVHRNPFPEPAGAGSSENLPNVPFDRFSGAGYPSPNAYYWTKRSLSYRIDYKRLDSGIYEPVKRTSYSYRATQKEELRGLKIIKYLHFNDNESELSGVITQKWSVFTYGNYYITCGIDLLQSVSETEYRDGNEITNTKNFTYNSKNLLQSTRVTNSDSKSTTEESKYPFDDEYKNQAPYDKMVTLNMLNYPIQKVRTTGSASETSTSTYREWNNNQILPEFLKTATGSHPEEIRTVYHNYDKYGNPTYIVIDNSQHIVYLWSYKGQYLIAEIRNATYSEVDNAAGAVGLSLNLLTDSATPDMSKVDALRKQLKLAQVTTYTYKPLVGIQTITDPREGITYYDYDNLNRLKEIFIYKDHNKTAGSKEIIETYKYNYVNH